MEECSTQYYYSIYAETAEKKEKGKSSEPTEVHSRQSCSFSTVFCWRRGDSMPPGVYIRVKYRPEFFGMKTPGQLVCCFMPPAPSCLPLSPSPAIFCLLFICGVAFQRERRRSIPVPPICSLFREIPRGRAEGPRGYFGNSLSFSYVVAYLICVHVYVRIHVDVVIPSIICLSYHPAFSRFLTL